MEILLRWFVSAASSGLHPNSHPTGAVQYTATRTTTGLDFGGNVLIDVQQKLIKPGIVEKGVTHWICLPCFFVELRRQPPRIIFKLFAGAFLCPSVNVIRNQGKSIRYFGHSQCLLTHGSATVYRSWHDATGPKRLDPLYSPCNVAGRRYD